MCVCLCVCVCMCMCVCVYVYIHIDLEGISTRYEAGLIEEDERKQQFREHFRTKQRNKDMHSLRCSLLNQLHVAITMKDFDVFYFPHNLDFRGRAYPVPPHLNHLGIYII